MSDILQSMRQAKLELFEKRKEQIEKSIVNANIQYHKVLLFKQELKKELSDIKESIKECEKDLRRNDMP